MYREFPRTLSFPHRDIPQQGGAFAVTVTCADLALSSHYTVHWDCLLCCILSGCWQMHISYGYHDGIIQNSTTALKILVLYLFTPPFPQNLGSHWFFVLSWFCLFLKVYCLSCSVYSVFRLKDILVVSEFWQLWIKLLFVSMCRFPSEYQVFSFCGRCQRV